MVTCLILNYNDYETTKKLIFKIKNYRNLDKILIVDNNSTDNSYELLTKHSSDKITVIKSEVNGGYGYGNNFGINYINQNFKSQFVLVANPDVEFEDETVLKMYNFLSENSNYAIIAPKLIEKNKIKGSRMGNTTTLLLSGSIVINKLFPHLLEYRPVYFENKKIASVDVVPGCLLMLNMKHMIEFGMYDEDMFLYSEERLLGHKFKKNNLKTAILLEEQYYHYHSQTISKNIKSIVKQKKYLLESQLIFLEKYKKIGLKRMFLIKIYFKILVFEIFVFNKIKEKIKK